MAEVGRYCTMHLAKLEGDSQSLGSFRLDICSNLSIDGHNLCCVRNGTKTLEAR